MPVYNYICKCGEVSEEYAKNNDETFHCPKCGKKMKPEFPVTGKPIIH